VSVSAAEATARLRALVAELRASGAAPGDMLNALGAVSGDLVGEISVAEFQGRLSRNFLDRVMAHARR
jgi:hypothetical protein